MSVGFGLSDFRVVEIVRRSCLQNKNNMARFCSVARKSNTIQEDFHLLPRRSIESGVRSQSSLLLVLETACRKSTRVPIAK
jgi:hypothetical protein